MKKGMEKVGEVLKDFWAIFVGVLTSKTVLIISVLYWGSMVYSDLTLSVSERAEDLATFLGEIPFWIHGYWATVAWIFLSFIGQVGALVCFLVIGKQIYSTYQYKKYKKARG
jgi:hypothetical protein